MFTLTLIKPRKENRLWQTCPIEGDRKAFDGFQSYDDAYKYLNELDRNGLYLLQNGWYFWKIGKTNDLT